jgi:hypothetical protein
MSKRSEKANEGEKFPPVGKSVLVRCDGFTCMAFRDTEGKWRDYFHRELLHGEVTVISAAENP